MKIIRTNAPKFRFEFITVDSLPRLAWCAEICRESKSAVVYHGSWVERRNNSFVEGAWDTDFADGDFDVAPTFTGTGGKATPNGFLFVTPTHGFDHLFLIRRQDRLWVSNSAVFALVRAGDAPAGSYPNYLFDAAHLARSGKWMIQVPTASRQRLCLYQCSNLTVDDSLRVHRAPKTHYPIPSGYDDYAQLLKTTTARVIANAKSPVRRRALQPLVAVSRGYDSSAIAAIAAAAGVRKAITNNLPQDNGKAIAERLEKYDPWRVPPMLAFQWGFEHVRERYSMKCAGEKEMICGK